MKGVFFSFFFLFRIFFIVKYFMMAACGVWFGCRKCVQCDNVYLGGGISLGTGALSDVLMGLLHRPGRFC